MSRELFDPPGIVRSADTRADLAAHPAADLFPMMSEEEFQGLKANIVVNGQWDPVIVWEGLILDGRNRYQACRELKRECQLHFVDRDIIPDPVAYVLSVNLHRRHLTSEQKRALIGRLLQGDPQQSNRQLAEKVGVDHKTVGYVRRQKESTGEIPQLGETVGRDGRARPTGTSKKKRRLLNEAAEERVAEEVPNVLTPGERSHVVCSDALDYLIRLPDDGANLLLFSPPYENRRAYDGIPALSGEAWVARYVQVIREALRVAPLVCCVCDGKTENYRWSAVPHKLAADLDRGGVALRHDLFYVRHGIPGSGGPDWLKNNCEYVICATRGGPLPWSVNTAMGEPPKFPPGGEPSHRRQDGSRVNENAGYASPAEREQYGPHRARQRAGRSYQPPEIANPGNVIQCHVGGGHIGDELSHQNEAPFPEELADFIIRSFCPPGGIVCDPFCGSGTTLKMALVSERRAIGCDIRLSQVELTRRRLENY